MNLKKSICYIAGCGKEPEIWFKHKKSGNIAQFHYCREHAKEMIKQELFKNYIPTSINPKSSSNRNYRK